MAENEKLVWIDLEMTGLNLDRHVIVEIACVVTDAQLNPLDTGVSFVVAATEAQMAEMDDFVIDMHTKSGLLPEIPAGISLADAEQLVLSYIQTHVPEPKKVPLAGSSIYVDRGFLTRYMPTLDDYLHYRLVDVSSIKELARRWFPRVYFAAPSKVGNHRAHGDIMDSIRELAYYRATIFTQDNGPDTSTARAISAQISGAPQAEL
jgi:oligoribonuclease